jgi:hypothetical protein
MKPEEVSPCPVCHEMPIVRRYIFGNYYTRKTGRRDKEKKTYLMCPCNSIVTEWHGNEVGDDGSPISADEAAANEWESIVSRLTTRK